MTTLTPEQLEQDGKNAYQIEDFNAALKAFEAAEISYQTQGNHIKAAEMANNRSVTLLQAGDPEGAIKAVEGTIQVFAEAKDLKRQAMAIGNHASAVEALGNKEQAEDLYWESANLLKSIGEMDLHASVLQSISKLQLRSGRYMEAIASMQSGLEDVEKPTFRQRMVKKLLQVPMNLVNRSEK